VKASQINGLDFRIHRGLVRTLRLREEILDEIADPEGLRATCRSRRIPADILTFTQHIPDLVPRHQYSMTWDNLAVLPISTHDTWLRTQTRKNTRKRVRKLDAIGVSVAVRELDEPFAAEMKQVFDETPIRRGRKYPYYQMSAAEILRAWSPDVHRCDFLACYHEHELIGFIKLLYGKHFARASGTVTKIAHRNHSPMNALISAAVRICEERGIPNLIYGKYVYGKRGTDGLAEFKRHNGFQKVAIPRYFVPLTTRGQVGLSLGLHRGLKHYAPAVLVRLVGDLRDWWNNRRT
jgi:GNAT acetyltransferase-like protein